MKEACLRVVLTASFLLIPSAVKALPFYETPESFQQWMNQKGTTFEGGAISVRYSYFQNCIGAGKGWFSCEGYGRITSPLGVKNCKLNAYYRSNGDRGYYCQGHAPTDVKLPTPKPGGTVWSRPLNNW